MRKKFETPLETCNRGGACRCCTCCYQYLQGPPAALVARGFGLHLLTFPPIYCAFIQ